MITLPKKKYNLAVNNWLNDGIVVKLAERNQGVDYDLTFVPVGTHALMPLKVRLVRSTFPMDQARQF